MAIDRMLNRANRRRISWYSSQPDPSGRVAFEQRGFVVDAKPSDEKNFADATFLQGLAAVIFATGSLKPETLAALPKDIAGLLDADCRVIVRVDARVLGMVTGILRRRSLPVQLPLPGESLTPLPHVLVYASAHSWDIAANHVLEHQPGPLPRFGLEPTRMDAETRWNPRFTVLLQRAFWDCSAVHIEQIGDGRSGAKVYKVFARLDKDPLGIALRMPLLVKAGNRGAVLKEFEH